MQFKKSVVVGVLITLYLSTDSLCHYIPEKDVAQPKKRESEPGNGNIRICGNELTTFIIESCNGVVGSLNQVNLNKGSVHTKIKEDCCDRACQRDYIQSYCGGTPLFSVKKPLKENAFGRSGGRSRGAGSGSNGNGVKKNKKTDKTERHNNVSRKWPSIQIGTVSPEIDKFGGQPIVIVRKNKSNPI